MKRFSILWHILLMLIISVLILLGIIQGLKVYTRQSEIIQVPSLKGKTLTEALKTLKKNNLSGEVVDSIYQRGKLATSVYDVVPSENSKVKIGRTIFLKIYSSTPTLKALPDIQDLPLRAAQERLKRLGFINITEKEVEGLHKGLCVGLESAEGELLEAGKRISIESQITLLVSGKEVKTLTVDDLISSTTDSIARQDSIYTEVDKDEEGKGEQPDNWF